MATKAASVQVASRDAQAIHSIQLPVTKPDLKGVAPRHPQSNPATSTMTPMDLESESDSDSHASSVDLQHHPQAKATSRIQIPMHLASDTDSFSDSDTQRYPLPKQTQPHIQGDTKKTSDAPSDDETNLSETATDSSEFSVASPAHTPRSSDSEEDESHESMSPSSSHSSAPTMLLGETEIGGESTSSEDDKPVTPRRAKGPRKASPKKSPHAKKSVHPHGKNAGDESSNDDEVATTPKTVHRKKARKEKTATKKKPARSKHLSLEIEDADSDIDDMKSTDASDESE